MAPKNPRRDSELGFRPRWWSGSVPGCIPAFLGGMDGDGSGGSPVPPIAPGAARPTPGGGTDTSAPDPCDPGLPLLRETNYGAQRRGSVRYFGTDRSVVQNQMHARKGFKIIYSSWENFLDSMVLNISVVLTILI